MFLLALATVVLPELFGHYAYTAAPIASAERVDAPARMLAMQRIHLREEVLLASFKIEENTPTMVAVSAGIPVILLAIGLLCFVLKIYTPARLMGMAAMHLSALWLLAMSTGALAIQLFAGIDCLHLLPWFMWAGPAAGLLLSECYLFAFDMNHLFWNSSVKALVSTQILCLLAFAANRL
jgi:hypothetical protein